MCPAERPGALRSLHWPGDSPTPPLTPATGWGVLHLFGRVTPDVDAGALIRTLGTAEVDGYQVVPVALLGHKADLGILALGPDILGACAACRPRWWPPGWS